MSRARVTIRWTKADANQARERARFLARHEDLRDAVKSGERDDRLGDVGAFQNARFDAQAAREVEMALDALTLLGR